MTSDPARPKPDRSLFLGKTEQTPDHETNEREPMTDPGTRPHLLPAMDIDDLRAYLLATEY